MKPKHYDFIVLGAGVSGLVLATELQSQGKEVLVLEAAESPGGVLQSIKKNSCTWDRAAHTIAADEKVLNFLDRNGCAELVETPAPTSKVRQLIIGGKIENITSHPLKILASSYLSLHAKFKIIREFFKQPIDIENPTVYEFFHYHFGEEITKDIISAVFSGIYAGDIEKMEMRAVMGKIFEMEQKKGSLLKSMIELMKKRPKRKIIGVKDGVFSLMDKLAAGLNHIRYREMVNKYVVNHSETTVFTQDSTFTCNQLISTLPAYALKNITEEKDLKKLLGKIEYAPIVLIHVAYQADGAANNEAFGFLNSQYSDSNLKGAIYNSSIFPSRTPKNMDSYSIFMKYFDAMDINEEMVKVLAEFQMLMGISGAPKERFHTVWKQGIPQFNKPYLEIKNRVAESSDIEISGSFISGVSVTDCITYNIELANNLLHH